MWSPMHQRPSLYMRRKRRQPRLVQEVPSIFLNVPETEELHRENLTFGDIEIGHCAIQGWRANMEDQFIIDNFSDLKDHIIVAIMDGHSGTFAAEYTSANLKSFIEDSDAWKKYVTLKPAARSQQSTLLGQALLHAYLEVDNGLSQLKNESQMPDESGCTAVCAIITPTHIVCANVGDSRCVVGGTERTVAMTEDHKPENPEEEARIVAAKGFVLQNRVMGELAMSRALGDFRYKQRADLPFHEQMVIAVPDISVHERNLDDDVVMVVACDGVWDVMSNDEGVVFAQQYIEKPTSFSIHDYMTGMNGLMAGGPPLKRARRGLNGDDDEDEDDEEEASESTASSSSSDSSSAERNKDKASAVNTASALISVALAKGSMDNISAVVVKFPAAKLLQQKQSNDDDVDEEAEDV